MKLNCDLGESFGVWTMGMDAEVMPLIDLANIACGFHASDPLIMANTVKLACEHQVQIGAHPAYPDLVGFGRRSMACSPDELHALLLYQVGALDGLCRAQGTKVRYMKPHGALYNDMMRDPAILETVLKAGRDCGDLPVMIAANAQRAEHEQLAASLGVDLMFEVFADRAYDDSGNLVPRSVAGSVLHDAGAIVAQAVSFARDRGVTTHTGRWLDLDADTLCIHGDNASSLAAARSVREALSAL
ncbi:5-oxoprolinase subunit PxpA [Saccharospirillum alexandrii]|uniref:5-oxoprolinase subunit PxpA n=1 Tax=Saccharospirillum alexandrii TaxID=2448477 RepID=UPI00373676D3